jgi:hypothetical protein
MARRKPKPKSPFLGRWHIVSMSMWAEDYLNEEVRAFLEFEGDEKGEFQFGLVRGILDYREGMRDGLPASNGRGRAATRWTRAWAGAGPSWRTTDSTG